jgi:hypothetical protein
MAIDFSWESGSAPRYALAYRRAADLRRAVARVPSAGASGTGPAAG